MVKLIYVIGPFNSGTNLLDQVINNCNCIDLISNTKITYTYFKNYPFCNYKHTLDFESITKFLDDPNNIVIIMYKNIYNWIYSIKKTHYGIKFDDANLYSSVNLWGKKYKNIIEIYNYYYTNYLLLLNKYGNPVKNVDEAKQNYDKNQDEMKDFVNSHPNLKNEINDELISFFENM